MSIKKERNRRKKRIAVKKMLINQNRTNPGAFGDSSVNRKIKYLKEHK